MSERELDLQIADALYNCVPAPANWRCGAEYAYQVADDNLMCPLCQLPWYSGDIEQAFRLVDAMRERGYLVEMMDDVNHGWHCEFFPSGRIVEGHSAQADTLPRAISLAALAALEDE